MKIVATVEARTGSTRLPGKVLLPVAGAPILGHLFSRLKLVPSLSEVVLATTVNPADAALVDLANRYAVKSIRGSELDVMARVIEAGSFAGADVVVEILGDCPLIDPDIIEQCIRTFLQNSCDYLSNTHVSSYPDGMDVQVFRLETLQKSYGMTQDPLDREHVTRHIRMNPAQFRSIHLVAPPSLTFPEIALTLDEEPDYILIRKIVEHFLPQNLRYSCADVVDLLVRKHPEWVSINRAVRRKGMNE